MASMTQLKLKAEDYWGIAGLAALWPCLQSSGFYPLSLIPAVSTADASEVARAHLFYSLELLLFFAIIIALRQRIDRHLQGGKILPILAGIAGLAGQALLMCGEMSQGAAAIRLPLATSLVALFIAVFVSLWGSRFSLFNNAMQAMPKIAVSYLLSQIILTAYCATGLPHGIMLCACAACTGICAALSGREHPVQRHEDNPASLRHFPWGMAILATLLIYFCIIYIRVSIKTFLEDSPSSSKLLTSLICALIFIAVVAYLVRRRSARNDAMAIFILLVCIYIIGLAAITIIPSEDNAFARRFLIADEHCFEVFVWMMLTSICIRKALSPVLVFGVFGITIIALPWMLSFDLYYLADVSSMISDTALISSITVALCVTALGTIAYLVCYTIRMSRNAAGGESVLPQEESPQSMLETSGLTQREIDIALLILRGHSAKKIAERLYISEPTVKSYTTRIYRKMNVHSKQEFIDCIEDHLAR